MRGTSRVEGVSKPQYALTNLGETTGRQSGRSVFELDPLTASVPISSAEPLATQLGRSGSALKGCSVCHRLASSIVKVSNPCCGPTAHGSSAGCVNHMLRAIRGHTADLPLQTFQFNCHAHVPQVND